ncbi:unnamed protein product [Calypogeia fissa]
MEPAITHPPPEKDPRTTKASTPNSLYGTGPDPPTPGSILLTTGDYEYPGPPWNPETTHHPQKTILAYTTKHSILSVLLELDYRTDHSDDR